MESLAEIGAHLRMLDETSARLETAAERQLELLEQLVVRVEQPMTLTECEAQHSAFGSGSQPERDARMADTPTAQVIDGRMAYSRTTHPALFKVIDLLEHDKQARSLSARQLAQQTGVSKSWRAIAKRCVKGEESVH